MYYKVEAFVYFGHMSSSSCSGQVVYLGHSDFYQRGSMELGGVILKVGKMQIKKVIEQRNSVEYLEYVC